MAKTIQKETKLKIYEYSPFEPLEFDEINEIKTNSIYIINEIHIYQSLLKRDKLLNILSGHRHYNLYIISNSQRPAMVDRSLTALSDMILTFRLTEERDLDYIKFYGADVNLVKNLQDYFVLDIIKNKLYNVFLDRR